MQWANSLLESGQVSLANSISQNYNYRYVEDIPQEAIESWTFEHGYTVSELMWIQPGYTSTCAPGQVI